MVYPSSKSPYLEWTSLPENLLHLILRKLILLLDIINFGAVCRQWHVSALERLHELHIHENMYFNKCLPVLLVPSHDISELHRNVYFLTDGVVHNLRLPVPYNKRCCGSSHGWLISIDGQSSVITLMNPFFFGNHKGIIHLPKFSKAQLLYEEFGQTINYEYFINKAILSADPVAFPNDYVVMVIYGDTRSLAFYKSGDEEWTYIGEHLPIFRDVIYHEGSFLAVNLWGEVYECNINVDPPTVRAVMPPNCMSGHNYRRYLVESPDGDILQVLRKVDSIDLSHGKIMFPTHGFLIFMLARSDNVLAWVSVDSLGDGSLFLGDNYSSFVNMSRFPGCKTNCIYFTDDYHDIDAMYRLPYQGNGPSDIGIYNLRDLSFEFIYLPNHHRMHMAPPIWLLPTV